MEQFDTTSSQHGKKQRRWRICLAVSLVAVVLWFLVVDKSLFLEGCYDCQCIKNVVEYRVFGVRAFSGEQFDHVSNLQQIARDFGHPCQHFRSYRVHRIRFWGLLVPALPAISGCTGIASETRDYEERVQPAIFRLRHEDPSVGPRLRDALRDRDLEYIHHVYGLIGLGSKISLEDRREFKRLYADYLRHRQSPEVQVRSEVATYVDCEAVRKIREAGWRYVPLVIGKINREDSFLAWVLEDITGVDFRDILQRYAGDGPRDADAQADAWVRWWREEGKGMHAEWLASRER